MALTKEEKEKVFKMMDEIEKKEREEAKKCCGHHSGHHHHHKHHHHGGCCMPHFPLYSVWADWMSCYTKSMNEFYKCFWGKYCC